MYSSIFFSFSIYVFLHRHFLHIISQLFLFVLPPLAASVRAPSGCVAAAAQGSEVKPFRGSFSALRAAAKCTGNKVTIAECVERKRWGHEKEDVEEMDEKGKEEMKKSIMVVNDCNKNNNNEEKHVQNNNNNDNDDDINDKNYNKK